MSIKVIVFDLRAHFNDESLYSEAMDTALEAHKITLPESLNRKTFNQKNITEQIKLIKEAGRDLEALQNLNLTVAKRSYLLENLDFKSDSHFLNERVLSSLKNENYKVILATDLESEVVLKFLKEKKLGSFFEAVITGHDIEKGKPSLDIAKRVIMHTGVPAKEILFFENDETMSLLLKNLGLVVIDLKPEHEINPDFIKSIVID